MELWMHGLSSDDPRGSLEGLKGMGFTAVVTGANEEYVKVAREVGLDTYVCTGTFSRSKEFQGEEFLAVDVEGKPREWFGSTCPNISEVRAANLSRIESALSETECDGLMLDGCRFASPASGLGALFTCFCPRCRREAEKMGLDFQRMEKDVRKVYRILADGRLKSVPDIHGFSIMSKFSWLPGIADWLAFRRRCVIEHFEGVTDIVHQMGAEMGAYIFTPCLSPLVGQDYQDLSALLDVASPMIYRNYPDDPGPACLNKETAALARYVKRGGLKDLKAAGLVQGFLGLNEEGKTVSEIDAEASLESVEIEMTRASSLLKGVSKRIPILYLGDEQLEKSVQAALEMDLEGVDLFVYKDEWTDAAERIAGNFS